MLVWGALSAAMACVHNYGSLLAFRFVLGCVESGFFPGVLFMMSCWYKTEEIGTSYLVPAPHIITDILQASDSPSSTVLQSSLEPSAVFSQEESQVALMVLMVFTGGDGSSSSKESLQWAWL